MHVMHPEEDKDLVSLNMVEDLIVQDKFVTFTIDLPENDPPLESELKNVARKQSINMSAKKLCWILQPPLIFPNLRQRRKTVTKVISGPGPPPQETGPTTRGREHFAGG